MIVLLYDTETTGLAKHKKPVASADHPYLVQLGALLVEVDERTQEFDIRSKLSLIRDAKDFEVPQPASDVHGITTDVARRVGLVAPMLLAPFMAMHRLADLTVCFNTSFDIRIIGGELVRSQSEKKAEYLTILEDTPNVCLKEEMTPVCKIPSPWGKGYKWPTLAEAYQFAFGEMFEDAHDALADVEATFRLYLWWLRKQLEMKGQ